jgi:hypothetical protein
MLGWRPADLYSKAVERAAGDQRPINHQLALNDAIREALEILTDYELALAHGGSGVHREPGAILHDLNEVLLDIRDMVAERP